MLFCLTKIINFRVFGLILRDKIERKNALICAPALHFEITLARAHERKVCSLFNLVYIHILHKFWHHLYREIFRETMGDECF